MKKPVNWIPAFILQCMKGLLIMLVAYFAEALYYSESFEIAAEEEPVNVIVFLSVALMIYGIIIAADISVLLLLFRCWRILPEDNRKITPTKAVVFLLIPFYNFYWAFVSYPALAEGYSSLGRKIDISDIKSLRGLGIAYALISSFSIFFYFLFVDGSQIGSQIFEPIYVELAPGIEVASLIIFPLFFKPISRYANMALDSLSNENIDNKAEASLEPSS
jgi:hypothetical protein